VVHVIVHVAAETLIASSVEVLQGVLIAPPTSL